MVSTAFPCVSNLRYGFLIGWYWGGNMATRFILHDAKNLATRDLFHVKGQPLFYQSRCKTQNSFFFTFLHFAVFWQIYFSDFLINLERSFFLSNRCTDTTNKMEDPVQIIRTSWKKCLNFTMKIYWKKN